MAHKRRLIVRKVDQEDTEELSQEMGWKDWLLRRYSRSWYWVGALFVDIMVFLQLRWSFDLDWSVALLVTLLLVAAEMYIFLRLWGRGAPLGDKDQGDQ